MLVDGDPKRNVDDVDMEGEEEESITSYAIVYQTPPRSQIETFTLTEMRKIVALFITNLVLAIVFGTTVVAFTFTYANTSTLSRYDLYVECVLRTVASALITFGLLAFPQRILRYRWWSTSTRVLATEWILIFALLLVSIIPGFSIYGVVMSWMGVTQYHGHANLSVDREYDVSLRSVLFSGGDEGFVVCAISSALGIVFQFGLQFILIETKAYPSEFHESDEADDEVRRMESRKSILERQSSRGYEKLVEQRAISKARWFHPWEECMKFSRWVVHGIRRKVRFPVVWCILLGYLTCLIAFSLEFSFFISYVPFVSMITVIRVCSASTADWTNSTIRNSTILNSTVKIVSTVDATLGFCSPNQPVNNSAFWITLACTLFFLFDLILLGYLYVNLPKAHEHLSSLPYMKSRSYYLGFVYFRFLTWYSFCALILLGLLTTSILPLSSFLVPRFVFDSQSNYTLVYVEPLFQVGVTAGNFGFGSCFLAISNWVVFLCYGNLPPDGKGTISWLCPNKKTLRDRFKSLTHRKRSDAASSGGGDAEKAPPLSPPPRHGSKENMDLPKGSFLRFETDIVLLQKRGWLPLRTMQQQNEDHASGVTTLPWQIESKVFVLETAVLLYHFMSLAYGMRMDGMEEEEDGDGSASLEDLQGLVEDPDYKLELYAQDEDTDTHGFVFSGKDRVIVSFRGSVSIKNYQTDYDSTLVVFEPAIHVRPMVDDCTNPLYAGNLAANTPPNVHRGFLRTYTTVRDRIRDCVKRLLQAEPKRVVMTTGHSLGAGLATVCAFDLALHLRLSTDRIALMTFGCPMVGNLSFTTRFNRIVPCAHRLATAKDVITQLPFQSPLHDITLRGWFHVGAQVLLMPNGNAIIEPTPIEMFMVHSTSSSIIAHFRLSYALALAAWAIRANEMHAKWWNSVIYDFLHFADFSLLPKQVRESLLRDLRRPGIPYLLNHILYRDMAFDTRELGEKDDEDAARRFVMIAECVAQTNNTREKQTFSQAVFDYVRAHPPPQDCSVEEQAAYHTAEFNEAANAYDAMQPSSPFMEEEEAQPLVGGGNNKIESLARGKRKKEEYPQDWQQNKRGVSDMV